MPDIDKVLGNIDDGPKSKPKSKPSGGGADKRLSVERIYQKKTQLEHILLRPDTYIGSVEKETQVCKKNIRYILKLLHRKFSILLYSIL